MCFFLTPIQLSPILARVEEDANPAEENVPHGAGALPATAARDTNSARSLHTRLKSVPCHHNGEPMSTELAKGCLLQEKLPKSGLDNIARPLTERSTFA